MARTRRSAPVDTMALPGLETVAPAARAKPIKTATKATAPAANDVTEKAGRLTLADLAAIDAQATSQKAAPAVAAPKRCPAYGCGTPLGERERSRGWTFCWGCQGDAGVSLQNEEASQRMTPRHAAIIERMKNEIAWRQGRKIPRPPTAAELEEERLVQLSI